MSDHLPLAGRQDGLEWVLVSPEMTLVIGESEPIGVPFPPDPLTIHFDLLGAGGTGEVRIGGGAGAGPDLLRLFVDRSAFVRLGGPDPRSIGCGGYHLPSALRLILVTLRDCPMTGEPRNVYRLAKAIELLCETIRHFASNEMVPVAAEGGLSFADTRRLMMARRMIDERWNEKLTLESIGRACGLNRAKLTSGFRDLFDCTIAEALAEQRLRHASRMLLTTDKPVSSIGYENGYLNNASFARAFSRRFGVSPSSYRSCGVAA